MLTHRLTDRTKPSRVVVLGSGGFVGAAVIPRLTGNGVNVLGLGRDRLDLLADDAAERLSAQVQPADTIIFLAALTPDKGSGIPPFLANLKMAAAVCTALKDRPPAHIVYVSSDAVYPFRTGLVNEESCAEPADLYGAMHLAREIMVKQTLSAPVAVLRPTLIYGAADTHNSYGPNRFRRMAADRKITLFGAGEETRDHIFIDDVAALIELTVLHASTGTLNLATGQSTSFGEIARKVAALFPAPVEIVETPRRNPVTHRAFDVAAIYRAFPDFSFTPLDRGLAEANRQ